LNTVTASFKKYHVINDRNISAKKMSEVGTLINVSDSA